MFFEGSEKKIELAVTPSVGSLRALGRPFWESMVHAANAEILSSISNDLCDAYLLSESSLFVWDDRFLMLTCGTTTLVNAAELFIQTLGGDSLEFFSYQRKNEYQSHLQKTNIRDDLAKLRKLVPLRAYQLGYLDSHHHYLFHLDKGYKPEPSDVTSELLMYHIGGDAAGYLQCSNQSLQGVRELLSLETLLPDFILDDFLFDPCGYSVNAIRGDHYATIHITPEQHSSYVSFETNLDLGGEHSYIVEHLLQRLSPRSWDTVGFNCHPKTPPHPGYLAIGECALDLSCGFTLNFAHHQHAQRKQLPIKEL
jgi:S-adenosylmethionine decarboxylase